MEAALGQPLAELSASRPAEEPKPDDEQQGGVARVADRLVAELDPAGGAELLVYGVSTFSAAMPPSFFSISIMARLSLPNRGVIGWRDQSA